MPVKESKRQANNRWDAANMTVLGCKVRKEKAEQFKTVCKSAGTTPNAVFTTAMDDFMEEHGVKFAAPADAEQSAVADKKGEV